MFPRAQTLGLDVRPRPGLTQHNTEKGTTDSRVIAPRPSLPSTRRSTCRTSRNFELPDPRERMNFLGATRTTEETLHRLPTCRSLRRPPPNGASEGRPMIPVWCTHATAYRSATRAAVGIPPSQSQPRQDRAARKHETVKPAKKKEKTAERYPFVLLTGEAIYRFVPAYRRLGIQQDRPPETEHRHDHRCPSRTADAGGRAMRRTI